MRSGSNSSEGEESKTHSETDVSLGTSKRLRIQQHAGVLSPKLRWRKECIVTIPIPASPPRKHEHSSEIRKLSSCKAENRESNGNTRDKGRERQGFSCVMMKREVTSELPAMRERVSKISGVALPE
jgi:hypothetical protein